MICFASFCLLIVWYGPTTGPSTTLYTWGLSGQAGDPSTAPAYLRQIQHLVNGQPRMTWTLKRNYFGQIIATTGSSSSPYVQGRVGARGIRPGG